MFGTQNWNEYTWYSYRIYNIHQMHRGLRSLLQNNQETACYIRTTYIPQMFVSASMQGIENVLTRVLFQSAREINTEITLEPAQK